MFVLATRSDGQCPGVPVPTTYDNDVIEGRVDPDTKNVELSSVGIDASGRFIIAYTTVQGQTAENSFDNDLFVQRFESDGTCICVQNENEAMSDYCPARLTQEFNSPTDPGIDVLASRHEHVSIAMENSSQNPSYHIYWSGDIVTNPFVNHPRVLNEGGFRSGAFDSLPFQPPQWIPPLFDQNGGPGDRFPSVGVSTNASEFLGGVGWLRTNNMTYPSTAGLALDFDAPTGIQRLRTCLCVGSEFTPCIGADSGQFVAIVWQESFSNVALQVWNADASMMLAKRDGTDGSGWVNNETDALQSPAVAIDTSGNIVVTWADIGKPGVQYPFRIRARVFDLTPPSSPKDEWAIEPLGEPFTVNSHPDWIIDGLHITNPTVSLTRSTSKAGRFIIAWNARHLDSGKEDVRAQYYDSLANRRGNELSVTQLPDSQTVDELRRRIAKSAQHTVAYRADDSVVTTWTLTDSTVPGNVQDNVYFTILPSDFPELGACCRLQDGTCELATQEDCDGPCDVFHGDGTTCIAPGVNCLGVCDPGRCLIRGDGDGDGDVDGFDIFAMVNCLLTPTPLCECLCLDMNADGSVDFMDIDCFVERLLDPLTPSFCEEMYPCPNGFLPQETAADCNNNGVSDEIDIAIGTSEDCNGNTWPDECEQDCNDNAVPDDCDIDPTDPDGNGQVSPDCNGNAFPDECDLTLPLLASLDCNVNGVPDECDIAGGASLDVNTNGIPDECELGACWHLDGGGCEVIPQMDCQDPCDLFKGIGTTCGWFIGTVQGPRPCCLPDDTCSLLYPCECEQLGGTVKSGLICSFVQCP
ncbi:MAG: hypothetical protein MI923_22650 [Phycisphaerales bacterium]|nr:hypothetical protein [Phycisphaerales bacterium]